MKKKIYLVSFLLLLPICFATFSIYNKTKSHTQNNKETKRQNQALDKESIERSKKNLSARNAESFSIDLKNADAETIYNTFNGPNADSIIDLLEMDRDDSDRILVSPDGTILSG